MTENWTGNMDYDKKKNIYERREGKKKRNYLRLVPWSGSKNVGSTKEYRKMLIQMSKLNLYKHHVSGQVVRGYTQI